MLKVLSSYYIAFHAASDEQSQNLFFWCSFLFRFVLLFCFVGLGKCGSSHRFPTFKPFDTHLPLVPTKISHNSWCHYLGPMKYTEAFQTLVINKKLMVQKRVQACTTLALIYSLTNCYTCGFCAPLYQIFIGL